METFFFTLNKRIRVIKPKTLHHVLVKMKGSPQNNLLQKHGLLMSWTMRWKWGNWEPWSYSGLQGCHQAMTKSTELYQMGKILILRKKKEKIWILRKRFYKSKIHGNSAEEWQPCFNSHKYLFMFCQRNTENKTARSDIKQNN